MAAGPCDNRAPSRRRAARNGPSPAPGATVPPTSPMTAAGVLWADTALPYAICDAVMNTIAASRPADPGARLRFGGLHIRLISLICKAHSPGETAHTGTTQGDEGATRLRLATPLQFEIDAVLSPAVRAVSDACGSAPSRRELRSSGGSGDGSGTECRQCHPCCSRKSVPRPCESCGRPGSRSCGRRCRHSNSDGTRG